MSSSSNELLMISSRSTAITITTNNVALHSKVHQRRMPYTVDRCAVCAKLCQYRYYNVRCCEGCKQFFRRTIVGGKHWACQSGKGKCKVSADKNKCRSCRLDRCLLVGMDWRTMAIDYNDHYIKNLLVRKRNLISNPLPEFKELEFFLLLASAQVRIKHAYTEFKDNFTGRFLSMDVALQSDYNLLAKAHEFSIEPGQFTDVEESAILFSEMEQLSCLLPRVNKFILVDHVICLSLIKLMPAFKKLQIRDKALFAEGIRGPLCILMNCYCSYEIGAETIQLKVGEIPMITPFKSDTFANDKQLSNLADAYFTNTMVPFTRTRLSHEEYALILPIFFTQTTGIQGLSEEARELLYEESGRYAKMLLRYCQHKQGSSEAGAKRFSECTQLINHCFYAVHNMVKFATYIETFYTRKSFQDISNFYSNNAMCCC